MDRRNSVGFTVRHLSRMIGRKADGCTGRRYLDSLTGTNGWIIGFLAHNTDRPIYQKDIEEAFSVRRSTVSRVMSLMEQKGLVERCAVSWDARLKEIRLTKKALEIHETIESELDAIEEKLVEGISDEDLAVFFRVAGKMMENMAEDIDCADYEPCPCNGGAAE